MPEDDIHQRDLSRITDEDLTAEDRREMHRRFDDFVTRLRERAELKAAAKKKPKPIVRWDPAAHTRRQ